MYTGSIGGSDRKALPVRPGGGGAREPARVGGLDPLDVPPEKAKEIAEAASQTDGIIFHLWPVGQGPER
jgi:hypothetical protein